MKIGDVVEWKKVFSFAPSQGGIGTILSMGVELDSLSLREVSICTIYSDGRIFKIPKFFIKVLHETK